MRLLPASPPCQGPTGSNIPPRSKCFPPPWVRGETGVRGFCPRPRELKVAHRPSHVPLSPRDCGCFLLRSGSGETLPWASAGRKKHRNSSHLEKQQPHCHGDTTLRCSRCFLPPGRTRRGCSAPPAPRCGGKPTSRPGCEVRAGPPAQGRRKQAPAGLPQTKPGTELGLPPPHPTPDTLPPSRPRSPFPPSRFPSEPRPSCPSRQGRRAPAAQPATDVSISLAVLLFPRLRLPLPLCPTWGCWRGEGRRLPKQTARGGGGGGGGRGRQRLEQAKGRVHRQPWPGCSGVGRFRRNLKGSELAPELGGQRVSEGRRRSRARGRSAPSTLHGSPRAGLGGSRASQGAGGHRKAGPGLQSPASDL